MNASPDSPSLADRLKQAPVRKGRGDPIKLVRETLSDADESLFAHLERRPEAADLVAGLIDHSPFLTGILRRHPDWLATALAEDPDRHAADLTALLWDSARNADEAALMRLLRRYRQRVALLVALADCGGVWSVETATRILSRTADVCVRLAVDHLLRAAEADNRLKLADRGDPGNESGLVVLALGKHGARELNYSSDIDIVLFYDPEGSSLPQNAEPARLFTRIAQGIVRILQERTSDGYVFRVDLRLRPDPGSTAPAVSLPAAFTYYETVGQNWERAAFIKARPIAGDMALGEQFLDDLAPFIWRRYFDFAAIADIHAMKRQIHAARGHETIAVAGHDIKLGRGGIREIEFFVQTQQLVFGGRRPALRTAQTLETLKVLTSEGWITPSVRDELSDAYRFLRTVEHRLQMMNDEQTQRLPSDAKALEDFARFCGFKSTKAFAAELTRQAGIVQGHYALLFEEATSLSSDLGNLVFTGSDDDPETLATLAKLGFRKPEGVTETIRGWHFGRRPAVTSARAREALTELTPGLLVSLGRTSDPDAALDALDRALMKLPAAAELMRLLNSNEALRDLFADILGTAPRLAEIVGQTPHVLDAVIDPAFTDPHLDGAALEARMRDMIGDTEEMEVFLDRIREVTRHEKFLIGARFLSGVYSAGRAGEAFAHVAQGALKLTFEQVHEAFAAEYGRVPASKVAVLGLGRLGAHELTAESDLDLVVLYDVTGGSGESDGRRSLDAMTYFQRLTQRFITAVSSPTRRGILYDVDLRLRPSGSKGPVATQFASFKEYYDGAAETWEEVALTKAWRVAGDMEFAQQVQEDIRHILTRRRDAAKVAADMLEMRALLAKEKGADDGWDLKYAAGALTDLDFAAAWLVLTGAADHPPLAAQDIRTVFAAAADAGLIKAADAQTLADARALFNSVLQWQRLLVKGSFVPSDLPRAVVHRIATASGCPDAKVLKATLDETRAAVRSICAGLYPSSSGGRG